jgi:pimeloyl-ACP methyl ester carboxylesterase
LSFQAKNSQAFSKKLAMPSNANIYYHEYEGSDEGQRTAVVLIHGAGGTHLYWPPELRRLPGYRVFALDLPGHGKSTGRGLQSIAAYAQAVKDWMLTLGLHSAVFAGHSMGSAIALKLALEQTDHVNGLVLLGAGGRLKVAPQLLENAASQTTYQNAVNLVIEWSFGSSASPRLKELAAHRMAETRSSVLYGDFLACNTFDETERIDQIRLPVLVVCGSEDKMTPLRQSQFLAEHIPGAILKIIPGAGHMVMLENPQPVAEMLLGFLEGVKYL